LAEAEEIIGVAELDRRLKRAIESTTGREWIEGEIASLKRAPSGHAYFTLRDEAEDAAVECVMYKFYAERARRLLSDGARVQVRGKATLWAPRGRLQLVAESMRLAGRGALLEALEQLKTKLASEGLFLPERKRPLPKHPRIVGVVTSPTGAAFQDIRTVAFRRGGVRLVLSPARVQGEGAPEGIVRALALLARYPDLDVVIVGRGGGSGEDLMAFNDERVVRQIAAMPVPVVSAVGHEIDVTLSDLVADVRAATPSQAAEIVIPDASAARDALKRQERLLARSMLSRIALERARVDRLRARFGDPRFAVAERQQDLSELVVRFERSLERSFARRRQLLDLSYRRLLARHPRAVISESRSLFAPLAERLSSAMARRLAAHSAELARRAAELDALSPLAVLGRGYAIAQAGDGRAIRAASEVRVGDDVSVRVQRGTLITTVRQIRGGEDE
jgi:exodeoxyribonuclease VII large subunit